MSSYRPREEKWVRDPTQKNTGQVLTYSGTSPSGIWTSVDATLTSEVGAGEDMGADKAVYISASNEGKLAKADSESTLPCLGFTTAAVSNGDNAVIQTNGVLGGFSDLTFGSEYYLSQTNAGEITAQKPPWGIIVSAGTARNSTELDINIIRFPNVFGTEYQYAESLGESSTTATTWQEKMDINISSVPSGSYKIVWSFEWSFSRTTGTGANFGIHVDWGALTLSETEMMPNQTYGNGAYYQSSAFGRTDLNAGNHKVAINFMAGGTNSIAYIRRAKLEVWRVS